VFGVSYLRFGIILLVKWAKDLNCLLHADHHRYRQYCSRRL